MASLSILKPLLRPIILFLQGVQRNHDAELVYLQHHELERPVIDFLLAQGLKLNIVCGTPADFAGRYAKADFVFPRCFTPASSRQSPELRFSISLTTKKTSPSENCWAFRNAACPTRMPTWPFSSASRVAVQNRSCFATSLNRARRTLQDSQTRFADQLVAEAQRLAWRYDFPVKDEPAGGPGASVRAEIGAIVAANSGRGRSCTDKAGSISATITPGVGSGFRHISPRANDQAMAVVLRPLACIRPAPERSQRRRSDGARPQQHMPIASPSAP